MSQPIVIDTNILVSALLSPFGNSALTIELCFQQQYEPVIGTSLFLEYEDVINREKIFKDCLFSTEERYQFLNDFLSVCRWVRIYYSWRPNLKDEGDNHIVELAIAGNANKIITNNLRDFRQPDLLFPEIKFLTPKEFLEEAK